MSCHRINNLYQAKDLTNRIVNSIRAKDSSKFARGIKKVIKESQREDKNDIT